MDDPERELILARARNNVARLRTMEPRQLNGDDDALERWAKLRQQYEPESVGRPQTRQNESDGMIYRTSDASPPVDTLAPSADISEREFIFEVVAGCIAKERERQQDEIDALKNRIVALEERRHHDLIESCDKLAKTLAEVQRFTEEEIRRLRSRSEAVDLPALPRRGMN